MWRQLTEAIGFLSIFIVPALLLFGVIVDVPSLAFAFVMLVFPLLRLAIGKVSEPLSWNEAISTALDCLPLAYVAVLVAIVGLLITHLSVHGIESIAYAASVWASLWMSLLFSTCVSHELIHRRQWLDVRAGHFLAGLAGYPVLAQEHLSHHGRPGDTSCAGWPRKDESVWRFSWRRIGHIVATTYGPGTAFWDCRSRGQITTLLRGATVVSLGTAAVFAFAVGWKGFLLYLGAMAGVWFGMQVIAYIQHWGLGDDRLGDAARQGHGWEDDCRLQAWVTLNISLHHRHHQQGRLPYYHLSLASDSPRLPANYVVLMVLCLFPKLWFQTMTPALEHWESNPAEPRSPGRRLTCFFAYGPRQPSVTQ